MFLARENGQLIGKQNCGMDALSDVSLRLFVVVVVLVFGFPPPNSRSSSFWVLAAAGEEDNRDMIQRR